MEELIIHIGFSKCGSSTLQNFLTKNPRFVHGGKNFNYCVMLNKKILSPEEISRKPSRLRETYGHLSNKLNSETNALKQELDMILSFFNKNETVIISNEKFASGEFANPNNLALFDSLNIPIRVFLVTRPPMEWLNSAFWQLGFFMDEMTIEKWVKHHLKLNYFAAFSRWKTLKNLTDIKVVDISLNPIKSFCAFIGSDLPTKYVDLVANKGSGKDLLRFLKNNWERSSRASM